MSLYSLCYEGDGTYADVDFVLLERIHLDGTGLHKLLLSDVFLEAA